MAILDYNDIGISAIAACVPRRVVKNEDLAGFLNAEELQRTLGYIGIREKRYVDDSVCASDLCYKAALKLFEDNGVDPSEIDAVIFLSQTPDYRQPATAPNLAHRLGIPTTVLSFDVNLACSGFVYGLATSFAFASNPNVRKVLLLTGETMSKTISQKDRATVPLFGDAGTAALIEKGSFGNASFSLNSDGSKVDVLKMPYGGYRNPSCIEGLREVEDEHGNVKNGETLRMDGMEVFNFGIRAVPTDIRNLLKHLNKTIDDVDVLVYHQANKFMTDFFSKHLKIPAEKTPYSLDRFGNTSSASVPLTIVSEMAGGKYPDRKSVMFSGFGSGLSWGTAWLSLEKTKISELVEF